MWHDLSLQMHDNSVVISASTKLETTCDEKHNKCDHKRVWNLQNKKPRKGKENMSALMLRLKHKQA